MIDQPGNRPLMMPRLSMMMFLQFFTWGTWFATLGLAMSNKSLGPFIGGAYLTAPIAAIAAPLFLGLIADRFFSSERVFGVLMLIGGGIMLLIPQVADSAAVHSTAAFASMEATSGLQGDALSKAFGEQQLAENAAGNRLWWLILAHMLCYMPTLGLGNTIAFSHIPSQDKFPMIRVWGTIGWIAAGLVVGFTQWDGTFFIFQLCAISSLALGVFCFMLPHTPPPLLGKPMDLRSLFMVDAFKLLGEWNFLVFAICSTAICVPLAWYHGSASQFLGQTGFQATGATLTLGQMSEIIFMVLIPFFFRRLGVKVMLLVGMAAWVGRYLLFSFGAPDQITWMLLAAVILHGICYDFFFVTGFIYTDQKSPKEIRGQAQSLLIFLTQGIGMFIGFKTMGNGVDTDQSKQYLNALKAAREGQPAMGFADTFSNMFSRSLPENLDNSQLPVVMDQWKAFYQKPALLAGIVLVVFALLFWDKTKSIASAKSEA